MVENVHAAKFGGKLINGPRNMAYTVNGGASAYTQNISNASHNWMYTGYDNPIYLIPVSSTNGSTVDYYTYYQNNYTIAYTAFLIAIIIVKVRVQTIYIVKFFLMINTNMINQ